jgi:hypothetical protein
MPSAFDTDFASAADAIEELLAEEITHYPAGDLAAPEPIDAIVDRCNEEFGGVGSGEGAVIENTERVALRRNALLDLDDSVAVSEKPGKASSQLSLFDFDGYRWRTVRILGRAAGKQKVLVTRLTKISTRRGGRPR